MRSSRLAAFFTSLSFFVIAALVAGVVVGAMAQGADAPWLTGGLGVVESLGQVWLNALRMTVIPLVHRGTLSAHSNTLGGVVINSWDSELWNIADWYRMK